MTDTCSYMYGTLYALKTISDRNFDVTGKLTTANNPSTQGFSVIEQEDRPKCVIHVTYYMYYMQIKLV